jgi:hypothetical protein
MSYHLSPSPDTCGATHVGRTGTCTCVLAKHDDGSHYFVKATAPAPVDGGDLVA